MSRREHPVGRAPHGSRPAVQDVRVDHRGGHVPVPQEFLYGADVVAVLEQVSGERVPKGVGTARWRTDSCRWWRRRWPVSRSR